MLCASFSHPTGAQEERSSRAGEQRSIADREDRNGDDRERRYSSSVAGDAKPQNAPRQNEQSE
jgi:hypothetical protein